MRSRALEMVSPPGGEITVGSDSQARYRAVSSSCSSDTRCPCQEPRFTSSSAGSICDVRPWGSAIASLVSRARAAGLVYSAAGASLESESQCHGLASSQFRERRIRLTLDSAFRVPDAFPVAY